MFHSRFPSRLRRAAFRCLLACAALACAGAARADVLGTYQSFTPAIAFDPGTQRGLAVYEQYGRIWGRQVDAEGRVIPGTAVQLFPRGADNARYRDPAILFKRPQNRYYVAAVRRTPREFLGQTYLSADGIELAALDRDVGLLAVQTIRTPGQGSFPTITEGERRPALSADTLNDASCCVSLFWTDARGGAANRLYAANFDPLLQGGTPAVMTLDAQANYATDVAVAYDPSLDRYGIAYNACNVVGAYCGTAVLGLNAWNFGAPRRMSLLVRGSRIPTRPAIAHVLRPGGTPEHRFVVAWNWREGSASGVGVNLVQDTGSALVSRNALPSLSYTAGLLSNTVARSNPRVISLEDGRRALVVASGESVLSGSGQVFATFTIDLSTVRTTMGFALSPSAPYIPWGDVALAPASGRAVAVWEQDTYEGGTWTRSYGY